MISFSSSCTNKMLRFFSQTNPEGRNKNILHLLLIQIHNPINHANQNRSCAILDNMHAATKDTVLNETLPKTKT